MSSFVASACAEFPNDNPALHRGVIWRCVELVGRAIAEAHAAPPPTEPVEEGGVEAVPGLDDASQDDLDDPGIEVVDEMTFDEIVDESPDEEPRAPAERDAFARLVELLEGAAAAFGGGPESVATLRSLLGVERVAGGAAPGVVADALVVAGLLERTDRGPTRSQALTREVLAWQGLLRGESDDLAACGVAPLDEWCARLVAAALGQSARIDGLRRELRRRGVAAFGLLEDAA